MTTREGLFQRSSAERNVNMVAIVQANATNRCEMYGWQSLLSQSNRPFRSRKQAEGRMGINPDVYISEGGWFD